MKKSYKKVAVIGRPNVGKSTLFNRLVGERKSIVDDFPGVTRDRLYANFDYSGKGITLIDTGGLVFEEEDEILSGVNTQVYSALEEADFIIFLVDGKSGITSADERIAKELRKIKDKKKIFLTVNKIDTEKQNDLVYDFYSLGLGEPYPISALCGSSGLADILDEVAKASTKEKIKTEEQIKISIVGKPNVGKSSILNGLLKKERAIVSSIAGTTRDSLDTEILVNGKEYLLVDTAGLRKKAKVDSKIERYATSRTISAIEKSDVVLLVVEAITNITDQDQKIASLIKNRFKPTIVVVNKWDLVEEKKSHIMNEIEESVLTSLRHVNYSKVIFTSAINRKNLFSIWELVDETYENYKRRISTGKLNKAFEEMVLLTPAPTNKRGKALKIYYATQADIKPPEIVLFVNDSELVKPEYERFLEKELRKRFDFSGTPIKLTFRNKEKTN